MANQTGEWSGFYIPDLEAERQTASRQVSEFALRRETTEMPRYNPERVTIVRDEHTGQDIAVIPPDNLAAFVGEQIQDESGKSLGPLTALVRLLNSPRNPHRDYALYDKEGFLIGPRADKAPELAGKLQAKEIKSTHLGSRGIELFAKYCSLIFLPEAGEGQSSPR